MTTDATLQQRQRSDRVTAGHAVDCNRHRLIPQLTGWELLHPSDGSVRILRRPATHSGIDSLISRVSRRHFVRVSDCTRRIGFRPAANQLISKLDTNSTRAFFVKKTKHARNVRRSDRFDQLLKLCPVVGLVLTQIQQPRFNLINRELLFYRWRWSVRTAFNRRER